ncbi:MAG: hypothetical protein RLZZ360_425 [Candidatus Parcubacteria bacterium]|jgi:hypothetical protein
MSEYFYIGKRRLLPLKDVAKVVPYSREYVARLARDGRVAAAQINRQWYIDPESLKNFFEQAQLEIQARGDYLRELRKQELDLHEWWSAFVQAQRERQQTRSTQAVKKSIVIILLGLFVGLLVTRLAPLGDPAVLASLVIDQQTASLMTLPEEKQDTAHWYETGEVITEERSLMNPVGILLLPQGVSEDPITFFSDEVSVIETGPNSGLIESNVSSSAVPFIRIGTDSVSPTQSGDVSP